MMTHDLKFDVPALLKALDSSAGYIGAIGSEKTRSERDQRLRDGGIGEADLARLHAPIGVQIGARTPEEVAVTIATQIIESNVVARAKRVAPVAGRPSSPSRLRRRQDRDRRVEAAVRVRHEVRRGGHPEPQRQLRLLVDVDLEPRRHRRVVERDDVDGASVARARCRSSDASRTRRQSEAGTSRRLLCRLLPRGRRASVGPSGCCRSRRPSPRPRSCSSAGRARRR